MTAPPPLIVIFGAAVGPGGRPSPALLRRIGFGYEAARREPDAPILCSGGVGRFGPSEASVMARVLVARGVAAERILLDEESVDTIQNVEAAVRQVRAGGHSQVIVCSDGYHLPRIRMLFAMHGVRARPEPALLGARGASRTRWIGMCLREALAIPHSLARLPFRRRVGPAS